MSGGSLGTAVGDALGLPFVGMRAEAIARRAPRLDRFSLLGRRGFVSDDTEQSALLAMCLARHPSDRARCVRIAFGHAWPLALARNLVLFPVVLVHAFRVLASRMTG